MQESDKKQLGIRPTEMGSQDAPRSDRRGDSEPPTIGPGSIVGKYRIVRKLGSGGMGSVYEATHLEIGKSVALKTLGQHLTADANARARFLREAASASQLEHPHVANVTDYGSEGGTPYLVMELLRGEDLATWIDRAGRQGLPIDETCDIMLAVCAGVSAAHGSRIVHRDLKPQNIFLASNRLGEVEAKVLDFGISKFQDDRTAASLTATGAVLGTPHYLSPEQVTGRELGPPSDQYSLGVILYECLTGRRPHEAETIYLIMRSIGEGQVVSPRVHRPDLPPELEAIVLRAMMKAPADRFGSVHELGKALLSYASSRRRLIWAEYYGRADGAASAPAGWAFPPTAPLPDSAPRRRPPSFPPTGGSAEFAPEPVPKTSTVQHLRGSGRTKGWLLAGGFLAIIGGAVAMLVLRSPAEHRIIPVESVRPASRSTVASTPILGEGSSESGRQAGMGLVREEVTISIADEPPQLEALVDGRPAEIPLRLPRGTRSQRVLFRAPGYEPKEITVDTSADRVLTLSLSRVIDRGNSDVGARGPRRTPKKRGHERAPKSEGAPPPMMDL